MGVVEPDRTTEFTEVGVIAPRVKLMAGVVVALATVPDTPLAVVTETDVTVPVPPEAIHFSPVACVESDDSTVPFAPTGSRSLVVE